MENWYLLSLVALLFLGSQRFIYKVAAEKGCSSALTTAVFMGTVAVFSTALYVLSPYRAEDVPLLIGLSLLNSSSFAVATISHIEALKHLPAGITFPLTRLSLALVIIASVVYFQEHLSPGQWLGILAAFAVVGVLSQDARTQAQAGGSVHLGMLLVGVCILCGALASISSKLAAEAVSKSGFMALSYLFGTGFSLLIGLRWGKRRPDSRPGIAIGLGVLMGVLNFVGFYAFLEALARGPLASIAIVTSMHFVIAIALSILLYRERVTLRRGLGIGLTLVAVWLLKN